MEAYTSFANVYDRFMAETEYSRWIDFIEAVWKQYDKTPRLVLDLGCGTGNACLPLAERGYEMIGADQSEEMLSIAREKAGAAGKEILYLLQDMREFELYGTVGSVISLCDSLNYILEEEELRRVFQLVNLYLDPGGLFIFDLNTEYKFQSVLGDNSFSQTMEDAAYIWENAYDEEEKVNEYYLNFFVLDQGNGMYRRYEEWHYERGDSLAQVKGLLEEAGLAFLAAYDDYQFAPVHPKSERITIVAQESGKSRQ